MLHSENSVSNNNNNNNSKNNKSTSRWKLDPNSKMEEENGLCAITFWHFDKDQAYTHFYTELAAGI